MAVGLSAEEANAIVTGLSGLWLKLHTGDPGAAATANAATETARKQITLGTPTGGSATNTVAIEWATISGSQTATHFSLWTLETAGTFEFSGTVTADQYTAGNTFTIAEGGLTVTVSTVAA